MKLLFRVALRAALPMLLAAPGALIAQQASSGDWPAYGRDPGGSRYSPLVEITRSNVSRLQVAWTFHTGEMGLKPERGSDPAFESTPILIDGTLYVSTPLGRVMALDPMTGKERWRFDASVNPQGGFGDFTNRGVSSWVDPQPMEAAPCKRRILLATVDARLIAIDAKNGKLCDSFGEKGVLSLRTRLRIKPFEFAAYEETSPPTVVNNVIVVGSGIGDNSNLAPASGEVRAFDARTGVWLWTWDPIPQDAADPAYGTWERGAQARTGAANAWSVLAADPKRDMVFVPTSSAAPDYYGGLRKGENRYANSIVALRASTGKLLWHFQTVHHDLWDYDNASPPALVTVKQGGRDVPAVLQATKTGMLFVLNRETGKPLFPVAERRVPASDVPGEAAWLTQPFTAVTPLLGLSSFNPDSVWGLTEEDKAECRGALNGVRNEGIFTPPSLAGTLVVPSNIGGAHWGGLAVDVAHGLVIVPVNRLAALVQLIPMDKYDRAEARSESDRWDFQYTPMEGTPYVMRRRFFLSQSGMPCTPPPFGVLVAVDLATGAKKWEVPLGGIPLPAGAPMPMVPGSPNLGGPIVTAGGLVFIAATLDRSIRAFDVETGAELWRGDLPAGGKATPMTYAVNGRQYVVIAAGGGDRFGEGDALVAFALPN